MSKQKIFVIIVSFNGENLIEKCLDSISKSSIKLETIVIDNASVDKTTEIINNKFPEVRVIKNKTNEGFGRANNIGFKLALKENADYVFLLNQDACIEVDTIEKLVEFHSKNREYGILSPLHKSDNGKIDGKFLSLMFRENKDIFQNAILNKKQETVYDVSWANAAAWLIPIETINIVGGFNPLFFMYGEDGDYCKRVKFQGKKIGVYLNSHIVHTRHNTFYDKKSFFKDLRRDIFDVKQYYSEQLLSLNYTAKQNFKSETRHFYSHIVNHFAFLKIRSIITYSLGYLLFILNIRKILRYRKITLVAQSCFIK